MRADRIRELAESEDAVADDAVTVTRRWFEAANTADLDLFRSIVSAGYVHHSGAGDLSGEDVIEGFGYYKGAFPDYSYELHELLPVDGGTATVARWTMRGTHTGGPFFGAEASGRAFASPGLSLHRVVDGKIVEEWEYNADVGLMRQLGFVLAMSPI